MKQKHRKVVPLIFGILLLAQFGTYQISTIKAAEGSTWDFDPAIYNAKYYTTSFSYGQNIVIYEGGSLLLANLTLLVSDSFLIEVQTGGSLTITNCTINSLLGLNVAITVESEGNLTIQDSTIYNIGFVQDADYNYDGRTIWSESDNIILENNLFSNSKSINDPLLCLYDNSGEDLVIENNIFAGNGGYDPSIIIIESNATYLELKNNTFLETSTIIIENSYNINITDNIVQRTKDLADIRGIEVSYCQNINITNNSFSGWRFPFYVTGGEDIRFLQNNLISSGIHVSLRYVQNAEISENIFRESIPIIGNYFIQSISSSLTTKSNSFITTNNFGTYRNPYDFGNLNLNTFSIDFGNSTSQFNTINTKPILWFEDFQYTEIDFASIGVPEIGMVYCRNITHSTIANLNISNAGGFYMISTMQNTTLQNFNISNSRTHGIYFHTLVQNLTIKKMEISNSDGSGIFSDILDSSIISQVEIENCFIGMWIHQLISSIIEDSTISNCGYSSAVVNISNIGWYLETGLGILVELGQHSIIQNNLFWKNWYGNLVIGDQTSAAILNFTIDSNQFGQFTNILSQQFGINGIDNSINMDSIWANNEFSDYLQATCVINGSAGATDVNPIFIDTDGDGASDMAERVWGSDYTGYVSDTDGDGVSDYDEIYIYKSNPNATDTDGDTLNDFLEINDLHSSPVNQDTDNDGYMDNYEFENGYDPTDPQDYPGAYADIEVPPDGEHSAPERVQEIPGYSIWLIISSIVIISWKKSRKSNRRQL